MSPPPPEACCVLPFRAKIPGTTHTGGWYLVSCPRGSEVAPAPSGEGCQTQPVRTRAVALAVLLLASGCGVNVETDKPVVTSSVVTSTGVVSNTTVPTTTAERLASTVASTASDASTTTAPPATKVASKPDDWIADLLADLQISDTAPQADYERADWGSGWSDNDSDCINTRHEVLALESLIQAEMDSSGCKVIGGQWFAAFTGIYVHDPGALDVDHFVPLANAHASGGWAWSSADKRDYYNDLSDSQHLIAVTASANRSKGSRGPDEWKPPDSSYWCQYAYSWADIKVRWGLTATSSEANALRTMLEGCDGLPEITTPPQPVVTVTTAALTTIEPDAPANPGNSKNCGDFPNYAQAKAWYDTYFPYYGDLARLDGDNDGEPCESLPGGP